MIKKIILWSLPLLALSCGTSKSKTTDLNSHLGTWVLEQRSGGFAGVTTDFDVDKKEKVLLFESERILVWEGDQKKKEQNYVIEKGRAIESSEPQNILEGEDILPQSIVLKEGKLILREQCYDCFTEVYQRIR